MWAELPALRLDRMRGVIGADTWSHQCSWEPSGAGMHRLTLTHTYSYMLKRASGHTPAHTHTQTSRAHRCFYLTPLCPSTPAHTDLQVMDMHLSWRDPWSFSLP